MSEFHLIQSQIARQLMNYKKEKYQHSQVTINLNSSDLRQRMYDSLLMSTSKFASQTFKCICNLQPAYGPEFSNYSSAINFSFPSLVPTHLEVLADNPENSCFGLFVHAVDFWIDGMAESFPKTVAGISNAQLEFDKRKESNLHTFVDHFMNKYDSTGLYQTSSKYHLVTLVGSCIQRFSLKLCTWCATTRNHQSNSQ